MNVFTMRTAMGFDARRRNRRQQMVEDRTSRSRFEPIRR